MKNQDPVIRSDHFDQRLADLAGAAGRSRKTIRYLIISICLDLVLTASLGIITLKVITNSRDLIKQNSHSIYLACQSVNKANAANQKLWTHLFDVSAQTPPTQQLTPEQKATQEKLIADFKVYISKTFAPEKC